MSIAGHRKVKQHFSDLLSRYKRKEHIILSDDNSDAVRTVCYAMMDDSKGLKIENLTAPDSGKKA